MNRLLRLRNRYWQTGFFLAVVLLAVWTVRHDEHRANSQICARAAILGGQVNYDTDLIRSFMQAAVKATKAKPGKTSPRRAAYYQGLANGLKDIPTPNCPG